MRCIAHACTLAGLPNRKLVCSTTNTSGGSIKSTSLVTLALLFENLIVVEYKPPRYLLLGSAIRHA